MSSLDLRSSVLTLFWLIHGVTVTVFAISRILVVLSPMSSIAFLIFHAPSLEHTAVILFHKGPKHFAMGGTAE